MLSQALVLGLIQGLTEFLPVSSSAHLILAPYFLHWEDPGLAFDVALHMGTLVAILAAFWKDWLNILKQFTGQKTSQDGIHWQLLVLGTIPGAVAGLLLEKHAEETFRNPLLIAITLGTFGLLLGYADYKSRRSRALSTAVNGKTLRDALIIGCAQALAIIPGVSRSGITITAALLLGFARPAALRFSFLLSAPIIAGAGVMKAKHIFAALAAGGPEAAAIGVGFFASLISGLFAVEFLRRLVKHKTFAPFAVYRVVLAVLVVVAVVLS